MIGASPSPYPQVQPGPAKKSYRWVIFVLIGVLGLTCLCAAVVAGLVITNLSRLPSDLGADQSLVDGFMLAGVKQDAQAAFDLFSSRGQQHMPLSKIQELFSGSSRPLFTGYQGVEVTSVGFHTGSGSDGPDSETDLNLPDGTFIILRGIIQYRDENEGTFTAVLEKIDQDVKLYDIQIGAPPSHIPKKQSG